MTISGIGNMNWAAYTPTKTGTGNMDKLAATKPSAAADFTAYMQQTPAQRMEESWLNQHGITKEKFAAMSPDERDKITQQMQRELADKARAALEKTAAPDKNGSVDFTA